MAKEQLQQQNGVVEYIQKAENDYLTGVSNTGKYVEFSQYENIEKITAYVNSKHISGDTDSLGREKPFFNIGLAIRNIWYRATDIDRKNIRIRPTKLKHKVASYAANLLLQEWMRKENFGTVLNNWGLALATYGSAVLKFVEKDGQLEVKLVPWNSLISDSISFKDNPKIEVLWLTPSQLRKNKSYDKEMVESLIATQTSRENLDGQKKDNRAGYIKVYEVHGEFPYSYLTGDDADKDIFVQQVHVVALDAKKESNKIEDYCLYKGKESRDPYFIAHLIPEDGRSQSIGAIEYSFEAQWMVNHAQKLIKDQLDLASKIILQTADPNFLGQNVVTNLEVGDVLIHAPNAPLTAVNNQADITSLLNFGNQWQALSKELTSTPDAMRGESQPAGTAWRQVEALRQESHSLFEQMLENKALALEEMIREFVIPYLKKQLDTPDELAVVLDSQGVQEFDSMYVPNEAIRRNNERIKAQILSGEVADNVNPEVMQEQVRSELQTLGNQRFLVPSDLKPTTWKEALKDLEWEVSVDISGEEIDKQNVLATLNTVFQTIVANPNILREPNAKFLFNKILELTDAVSPLELAQIPPTSQPQPVLPTTNTTQPDIGNDGGSSVDK